MKLPSPSMIIALSALALSAGGAGAMAHGLVTGAQVKNGSLTGADIRNGSITLADLSPGARKALRGKLGPIGH